MYPHLIGLGENAAALDDNEERERGEDTVPRVEGFCGEIGATSDWLRFGPKERCKAKTTSRVFTCEGVQRAKAWRSAPIHSRIDNGGKSNRLESRFSP